MNRYKWGLQEIQMIKILAGVRDNCSVIVQNSKMAVRTQIAWAIRSDVIDMSREHWLLSYPIETQIGTSVCIVVERTMNTSSKPDIS